MSLSRRSFSKVAAGTICAGLAGGCKRRKAVVDAISEDSKDSNPVQVVRTACPLDPDRQVSILGLGGVRLPVLSGNLGSQSDPVDYEYGSRLVDYAYRHGVNYFDTGYHYHSGDSERFFGYALSKYPRESYFLCTKMPTWSVNSLDDAKRIFEEQLKRCRVSYFDNYMLHSLVKEETYERVYIKNGVLDYLKEERAKGRIKHLGFSFHGQSPFMERLLEDEAFETALILVNGIDWLGANNSKRLHELLVKKDLPVFVMEPLVGGRLAKLRPEAHQLLQSVDRDRSDAAWAFNFASSRKNVVTTLTGFTRFEHLRENILTFSNPKIKDMSGSAETTFLRAMELERGGGEDVPCTNCKYCMPCPYGVDIPKIFSWWNGQVKWKGLPSLSDGEGNSRKRRAFLDSYFSSIDKLRNASRCIGCERCETACPQWQFKIPVELVKIDEFVEKVRECEPDYGCNDAKSCVSYLKRMSAKAIRKMLGR